MESSKYSNMHPHKKSQSVDLMKKMSLTTSDKVFKITNNNVKQINNHNINNKNHPNNINKNSINNYNHTNNNINSNSKLIFSPKATLTSVNFFNTKNFASSTLNNFNTFSNRKTGTNFYLNEFHKKFQLDDPSLGFEKYKKSAREIMTEYKYEATAQSPVNFSEKKLYLEDQEYDKIRSDIYKNSKGDRNQFEPLSPDAKMKICINHEEYKSPERAFGVIWKNKIIHENMIKNYYSRQKIQYDDFLKKIEEIEKFSNISHKRMKISNCLINKNLELNNGNINLNDNLNTTQQGNTSTSILSPTANKSKFIF